MNDDDDGVNRLYISGMVWWRGVAWRRGGIGLASCIGVRTERMCIIRDRRGRQKMPRRGALQEILDHQSEQNIYGTLSSILLG